jgi:FAD/FMN-containing dehydrogenase
MSDVQAAQSAPASEQIDKGTIQAFRAKLRGNLILPGDPAYDTARKVYNGMIDRRPRFIVLCANVADVIHAVNFGREHRLELAIRGGSHNVVGFAVCDDGLVIDLSDMKGIRVDQAGRTARVEGGCTWGDVDHATHVFGLATAGGIISTTGVGGLTLGGGIGHLTRKCGLSCDNLISVDIVTADGRLLTASETENPDLFWAVRGGGGNFGVVTSFEFRLHPVSIVYAGPVLYPLERAAEVMRLYRDYMAKAPEDMNAFFAYLIVPPGPPFPEHLHNKTMCGMVCCYTGPLDQGPRVLQPLVDSGPAFQHLGPVPFPMLQSLFDPLVPAGMQHYWKADFIRELSDEAIAVHVKHGPQIPTVSSAMHIYPVDGAAHRPKSGDTAFSYRDAKFVHVLAAMYDNPADTPARKEWVRQYWTELHPYSAGGAYVNFLMEEGDDRIAASYRDNYPRLVEVKRKYDPQNLFHLNQNIRP